MGAVGLWVPAPAAPTPPDKRPGQLDKSFSPCKPGQTTPCDGKLATTVPVRHLPFFRAHATAIRDDGKIVIAGQARAGNSLTGDRDWFALAQYNEDGTLDETFGVGGLVMVDLASKVPPTARPAGGASSAHAVAIQPDGKIVAAGCAGGGCGANSSYPDDFSDRVVGFDGTVFAVARFDLDGSPDQGFGSGGAVTTRFGAPASPGLGDPTGSTAFAISIQADGKLVAAGGTRSGVASIDFALARYNSDGSPDSGFGAGGTVVSDVGLLSGLGSTNAATRDVAYGMAVRPDGKIFVGGDIEGSDERPRFGLVRYTSDGRLDCSLITVPCDAINKPTAADSFDRARALVFQPEEGKIVLAGSTRFNKGILLARYTPEDLVLDATFGSSGRIALSNENAEGALGLEIYPAKGTNMLLASGYSVMNVPTPTGTALRHNFAVARFSSDGIPDSNFGQGGKTTVPVGSYNAMAEGLVVQKDGSTIAVGSAIRDRLASFALARFDANGRLDKQFGDSGTVLTDFGHEPNQVATGFPNSLALQADGKTVLVGSSSAADGFMVMRFGVDGSRDAEFNRCRKGQHPSTTACGGSATTVFEVPCPPAFPTCAVYPEVTGVGQQPSGRIIVLGTATAGLRRRIVMAGYKRDGTLDEEFDSDGRLLPSLPCESYGANSLSVQPDGRILVLGDASGCPGAGGFKFMMRYTPDGELDGSFGANGIQRLETTFTLRALALQADGKILIGGSSSAITSSNSDAVFALLRLNPNGSPDDGGAKDTDPDDRFGVDGTVTTDIRPLSADEINDIAVYPADGNLDAEKIVAG